MTRVGWLTAAAVVLGIGAGGGCGGDVGDSDASPTPAERTAVEQLRYCFEGAGALTAEPGKRIPQLDRTPAAPETGAAKRVLVAYWPDTGDVAHLYFAADAETAARVARDLSIDGVEWNDRLIVVPDEESPPSEDEALLASDCLP
jgi:hypothetical protein